ncbi:Thioredoxin [Entamoeba marina]
MAFIQLILFIILSNASQNVDMYQLNQYIQNSSFVVVLYTQPWCMHCKELSPIYEDVTKELYEEFVMLKVDCSSTDCSITSFPVIELYRHNKLFSTYNGLKKKSSIIRWIRENTQPNIISIDQDDIEDYKYENDILFVLQYNDTKSQHRFEEYLDSIASDILSETIHFVSYVQQSKHSLKVTVCAKQLLNNGKFITDSYVTNVLSDELKWFIRQHSIYPIVVYGSDFDKTMYAFQLPYITSYIHRYNDVEKYFSIVENYWGRLIMVIVLLDHPKPIGSTFYVQNILRDYPTQLHLRTLTSHPRITYYYEGDYTKENVALWIDGIMHNTLSPTIRSSVNKRRSDSKPFIVTAHNFVTFINQQKDILLYSAFRSVVNKLYNENTVDFGVVNLETDDVLVNFTFRTIPSIVLFDGENHTPHEMYYHDAYDALFVLKYLKNNVYYSLDHVNNILIGNDDNPPKIIYRDIEDDAEDSTTQHKEL